MDPLHVARTAKRSFIVTLIIAILGVSTFFVIEPVAGQAAVEIFTVSQSITGEISFYASTTDVVMSPSIPGVSGGTANGAAVAIVNTNNPTGYNMTIEFATGTAMVGEGTGNVINNYTPTNPNAPDYSFSIGGAGTPGEMAYSVVASSSGELDLTFRDNGSDTCGVGAGNATNTCWYNASTTDGSTPIAEQVILSAAATPSSGSTSTIKFRVSVPTNPAPALPVDTYTATATLTAVTN